MKSLPKIAVIGTGKLGTSLCLALRKLGFLELVIANNVNSLNRINEHLNFMSQVCLNSRIPDTEADVFIIAVNDQNIKTAAESLFDRFGEALDGKLVFHCSGSAGFAPLDCLKNSRAITGIAHPYQAFFYYSESIFQNICWAVDSKEGFDKIDEIVRLLGGKPFAFDFTNEKLTGLYHASAVVASNYMNLLISMSSSLSENTGIPINEFIIPILETTLANNIKALHYGIDIPLTGPISRKDIFAIGKHVKALSDNKPLKDAYLHLSKAAAIIAREKKIIDDNFFKTINLLLDNETEEQKQ